MNRFPRLIQFFIGMVVLVALSGCSLGQGSAVPTATPVDINAVMTSAAATAFVQLTQIAGQASPTAVPSQTPTNVPPTKTPDPLVATSVSALEQITTPTAVDAAAGLPAVNTPLPVAGLQTNIAAPGFTPQAPVLVSTAGPTCFNSAFVADVTIPDGTVMQRTEKFTKVWRIQNTGVCAWDEGYGLIIWAGPAMNGAANYFSKNDASVQPGGIVDMWIEMRAPAEPGDYIAHWKMINDQGTLFGTDLTVFIKVAK